MSRFNPAFSSRDGFTERTRKALADDMFPVAEKLAADNEMVLLRHDDKPGHYSLTYGKWKLHIYLCNQWIGADKSGSQPPHLDLVRPWNLIDVVREAIRKPAETISPPLTDHRLARRRAHFANQRRASKESALVREMAELLRGEES